MFDIGGGELLVILFAVLLLFGPKKIPEISRMVGKGMNKIKQAQAELKSQLNEIEKEIDIEKIDTKTKIEQEENNN
jgi:sec-independent protein translocase protein TatA